MILETNPNLISPLALAFVGDAVFSVLTRERLAVSGINASKLHGLSIKLVSAGAQAAGMAKILPMLSEEETAVFKRGRNAHTGNVPKNASAGEYHTATGLEALFGYLHLRGEQARMNELFEVIWQAGFGNTTTDQTE